MNNKSLSIIVILCTMISVCVMLLINQEENPKFNNKSYIMLYKNNNLKNMASNYDKKSSDDSSKFEKDISNMQKNDIKKDYNNEYESNNNLEFNNNLNKNHIKVDKPKEKKINEMYENSEKYEYACNENKYKKGDQKDIPVFKVSTDVIKKELSFRDKQKLFFMASKLSPFDFGRIKKDLYCPDAEEGVKDALMLVKERLSEKDYEKLKDILDEYINMEAIEKES